jgi:uncharacterized protein
MEFRPILFDQTGRLRSGWRFALFLAAFVFAGSIANALLISALVAADVPISEGSPLFLAASSTVSLILALVIGYYCGKYLEGLPFRALGASPLPGWGRNLGIGLLLGLLTIGIAVGIGMAAGGISFQLNTADPGSAIARSMAFSFAVFAVAAAFEEALFRGYILQTFARSGLAWFAIILTSAFFASVHLMNPGAGEISTLNTAIAGIWFGVAYLKTRDLWFVTGLHFMWNWAQGSLLGIEVSGLSKISEAPLLREIEHGPEWLTGGDYGIEAGIITTIALIISTAAIPYLPYLKRAQVDEASDAQQIQNLRSKI